MRYSLSSSTSVTSPATIAQAIAPSTPTFATALASSTAAVDENIRFIPAIGSIRLPLIAFTGLAFAALLLPFLARIGHG
mgnify:CR=1 FL=1